MLRAASQSFPLPAGYTGQVQPYVLSNSAIPFIGLSTGSVSAAGAITGITALPRAFANAYCWFPANALATSIAAGWYYCTFSTTTAGTAFLNTYTSGAPTIPASPTAVTDGKGSFTGDTGEEFGPTITVPANAIGANGALRVTTLWGYTNSAGTKTVKLRYSGNAGTAFLSASGTTTVSLSDSRLIINRGVTGSQIGVSDGGANIPAFANPSATNPVTASVDTTAASTLVLSITRNTATDNAIIESFLFELIYGA